MNDIGLSVQFDHFYRESIMIENIKKFSEADIKLLDKLSSKNFFKMPEGDYAINKYELAYVMEYAVNNFRYFDIGHEKQRQFSNLLKYADRIEQDNDPDNFRIVWYGHGNGEGLELPTMSNNSKHVFDLWDDHNTKPIFYEYKQEIIKIAARLKEQPDSVYMKREKNSPIKTTTKEIYVFLQNRFKLGVDQAKYVIGYIYAHYGICLKDPILTEEQWNADEKQKDTTYRDYLKKRVTSYLK